MTTSKNKRLICREPRQKDKRERLIVDIPKGKLGSYKMAARELGLSLSKLIQNGVEEYIKNHGEEFITEADGKKLQADFARALEAVKSSGQRNVVAFQNSRAVALDNV